MERLKDIEEYSEKRIKRLKKEPISNESYDIMLNSFIKIGKSKVEIIDKMKEAYNDIYVKASLVEDIEEFKILERALIEIKSEIEDMKMMIHLNISSELSMM